MLDESAFLRDLISGFDRLDRVAAAGSHERIAPLGLLSIEFFLEFGFWLGESRKIIVDVIDGL